MQEYKEEIKEKVKRIGVRFEGYGFINEATILCYWETQECLVIQIYSDWWEYHIQWDVVIWGEKQYKEVIEQLDKILEDTQKMASEDEDKWVKEEKLEDHLNENLW